MRLLLALLPLLLASCSTIQFYTQAVAGQADVMIRRQPVSRLAADASTDEKLRKKLELTTRLLAFARDHLDMPSGGAYEMYADLQRPHLVWVIHAAPELSMEAKQWWYPVIGKQSYRGYFNEADANAEQAKLHRQGYETWCDGIDAYSTLGMFRDPLLNTFIDRDELELAELIFHELSHRRYHVTGDTKFNEGMAEAVARESVRRWFTANGRPDIVAYYEQRLRRLAQARTAISTTSERLKTIYDSDAGDAVKRQRKAREYARLKTELRSLRGQWGGGLTSWINDPINNARLNSFTTYEDQVPRFTKLLHDCHGDFPTFWTEVRKLKK
ncbi:aminopeptidase [Luteolibacter sp. LG18]|uniref:aminopeptidase n=1 Tax=Luteolibacter sp. LG18 TaxID=2819286 RepID=UPI0030C6D6F1